MGPEHLGVRPTQCAPCAEMVWLVILHLFSYRRISFREGNTGRQKVPGAARSTGSLIFLASYTKSEYGINQNLCELPSVEGMLTPMAPAPAPSPGGWSPAPYAELHWTFPPALWPHAHSTAGWGTPWSATHPMGKDHPQQDPWKVARAITHGLYNNQVCGGPCNSFAASVIFYRPALSCAMPASLPPPSCNVLQTLPSQVSTVSYLPQKSESRSGGVERGGA